MTATADCPKKNTISYTFDNDGYGQYTAHIRHVFNKEAL